MAKPFYGDESPITALATPPGESALALIRTSGPGSVALLSKIFSRPEKLSMAPGNSIVHGWICSGGLIDEVLISVYRAPKSYTGEEGADISCHGGAATVKAILSALTASGFREALPGEFSFRAFMNGKLDLTRSESVMELVKAKTDRGREHAVDRLSGKLQDEIAGLNHRLVEILAETELHLDYDDTELPEDAPENSTGSPAGFPSREKAEQILAELDALADTWRHERLYQEACLAVIAGRPNAGKSSLFNALLGEDRSIVTEIPGTTRDWIEALLSIEGIPLRLADTAGLRDSSSDQVERMGIERSRELLDRADLVLYVIDGTRGIHPEDRAFLEARAAPAQAAPVITLWNKADLAPPPPDPTPFLAVSAKTGAGLGELCKAVATALESTGGNPAAGSITPLFREGPQTGLGTGRQKALVDSARAALAESLDLAGRGEALDLIAPLLREAVNSLGEITGEVSTADILETIFSKFCVGK